MKYRCVSCDHVFESEGAEKPRCPRCLGIHEVEPVAQKPTGAAQKAPRSRGPHPWIVAAVVVALGAGGYFAYAHGKGCCSSGGAPVLDAGDLRASLVRLGVPADKIALPFEATDAVRAFAQKATSGKEGGEALEALLGAFAQLKKQGRWTPHHQRTPRLSGPLTADALIAELSKDRKAPYEATSYELACLLLAAARAAGVEDAHMAQIFSFTNVKAPADPAGKLGRYGVALGKGTQKEPAPLYDPYELRSGKAAVADLAELTDEQAVAPYYSQGSLAMWTSRKSSDALVLNDLAVKLDPDCALFRSGRGLIFLASGALDEAIVEFEKAVKRRDDAVSHVNLAEALLGVDPTGTRTAAELEAALAKMPDYARARASLAAIHAARGDFDTAESELKTAERLAPDSPDVAFAWAGYYAARHEGSEAVAKAEQAVRLAGEDMDSLLSAAGIYMATARFDQMRAALDKVLAKTDSPEIAEFIKGMFGYDPGSKAEVPDAGAAAAGGDSLQLKLEDKGSPSLMGGGGLKLGPGLGAPDFGGGKTSGGLKLKYDVNQ
jgi:hypothetical protein